MSAGEMGEPRLEQMVMNTNQEQPTEVNAEGPVIHSETRSWSRDYEITAESEAKMAKWQAEVQNI